jgi:hypothetical protein
VRQAYALTLISQFAGELEAMISNTGTARPLMVTHTPFVGYESVSVSLPGEPEADSQATFTVDPLDAEAEVLAFVSAQLPELQSV